MVVPGTPRDSLFNLDTPLNLDGGVTAEMAATDNASYSDMVFGLVKLLGYRFSPRFRDLSGRRVLAGGDPRRAGGPLWAAGADRP